jgi:hypothetical protein
MADPWMMHLKADYYEGNSKLDTNGCVPNVSSSGGKGMSEREAIYPGTSSQAEAYQRSRYVLSSKLFRDKHHRTEVLKRYVKTAFPLAYEDENGAIRINVKGFYASDTYTAEFTGLTKRLGSSWANAAKHPDIAERLEIRRQLREAFFKKYEGKIRLRKRHDGWTAEFHYTPLSVNLLYKDWSGAAALVEKLILGA